MNQMDFRNRRAVITGGAAGIGLAVATRLVASGARVALWDRDERALASARVAVGGDTVTHALDVADSDAAERAARSAEASLGGVDVLVCSAGITGPNATTWTIRWTHAPVSTSTRTASSHCNRAIVPIMQDGLRSDRQHASVAGKEGNPNAPAYSASKAAVIGLTKSPGKELRRRTFSSTA
jgi:3-oxoacyl-[acyl-carrier protein] reductase